MVIYVHIVASSQHDAVLATELSQVCYFDFSVIHMLLTDLLFSYNEIG